MRFSVPITITKAGAPVTPHLVSVHLGGSSNVDALGYQKSDGSIVLFQMGGAAVILDQPGKINIGFDYSDSSCFFGNESEQAYEEFASQYDWMVPSLGLYFDEWGSIAYNVISISDPDTGNNLLVAYDICNNMDESNIELPLDVFVPEIDVDVDTAFVTSCEVDGYSFLALSVNGVVRPIYDVAGNQGCQMSEDGGTFNVDDCQTVGAAGVSMSDVPLQAALGNLWRARSCSIDGILVTTFLTIEVYMLGYNFIINTDVITNPAGTWYIPTSQFTVTEA